MLAFATLKFPKVTSVIKGYIDDGNHETNKKQCSEDDLTRYYKLYDEVNPEANCKNEQSLRNITYKSHFTSHLQLIVCYE